ncbi:hexose transporter-like protein [Corynespora cassiicola Philippines]|uniref:Hexose transporter-like protein n=1 Tax=Corynespora cassiicola Philippines TaxID=1448308 RepID=A0A2T2N6Y1_CORCC|nr:hexose transporter-like protein [Corynespora cassiicola Philippines]
MSTPNAQVVGQALAEVLPRDNAPWYRVPHLLSLNILLLIPLMSSSVAGYDGSLMNGLQALPSWKNEFGNPKGYTLGAVNAAQSAGCVLALPVCGILSDRIGRRYTLLLGGVIIVIASVIQSVSVNLGMFIFSRVVVGVGGIISVQPSPLLISELCYPTHRGIYTALFWTCYYLGAIIAAWSTFGLQKNVPESDWAWRGPSILQGGLPLLQLLFWFKLPESPRWLIAKGRQDEARSVLARFHTGGDAQHALIEFEMNEIETALEMEVRSKQTKWTALIEPRNRKRMLITCLIGFFSQWAGNGVVSYYMTLVLDTVGVTNPDTQTLINGLLQLFNFFAAVCAAFLVDRLGRRTLFNWSGIGMLISFTIWTICSARFAIEDAPSKSLGIAVIAFIFIYFFHYDIAYTPLVLAYPTEILQYSIRSKGLSVEMGIVYSSLVVLSFVNPIALEAVGWKYYILFCCILAVSVVVNWFLLPETKGRSLEEIAELFEDGVVVDSRNASVKDDEEEGITTHIDIVGGK